MGSVFAVTAQIALGGLRPEDVRVELYYGPMDANDELTETHTETMTCDSRADDGRCLFRGLIPFRHTGKLGYAVRILPRHPLLVHPVDTGLVVWG